MNGKITAEGFIFEQLVAKLLVNLGFIDVVATSATMDMGFDYQATYPSKSSTELTVYQKWIVEVKHRQKSRISVRDIAQLTAFLQVKNADKALLVTSANLTSSAKEYVSKFNQEVGGKLEIWDRDQLSNLLEQFPELQQEYSGVISDFPGSLFTAKESIDEILIERLRGCPSGKKYWRDYENVSAEILTRVFHPHLKKPKQQPRTLNGLERRDALFSLRRAGNGWEDIRKEFEANFLLCEFKNYSEQFGKDEVNQTRNYLKRTIGRIGVIFSRKGADDDAQRMRNSIYAEEQKVILFFEDKHLVELLQLKAANQNPLDLIQDAIDEFYILYE